MNNIEYAIELKDVKKVYGKEEGLEYEIEVLKGITLRIRRGSFVSIMGPSGSGKTTLLDIMGCLLRPTEGDVFIDGIKIDKLNDNELAEIRRNKIGFVFQQYNLISALTALENVELPLRIAGKTKKEAGERATELLKTVGLSHRLYNRPSQLSGGEQQRVAIARALANNPSIILGDEPTGNLDTKTGKFILRLLRELNRKKGYTVVLVTHDERVSAYADKIIKIQDGKIIKEEKK